MMVSLLAAMMIGAFTSAFIPFFAIVRLFAFIRFFTAVRFLAFVRLFAVIRFLAFVGFLAVIRFLAFVVLAFIRFFMVVMLLAFMMFLLLSGLIPTKDPKCYADAALYPSRRILRVPGLNNGLCLRSSADLPPL